MYGRAPEISVLQMDSDIYLWIKWDTWSFRRAGTVDTHDVLLEINVMTKAAADI